MYTYHTCVLYSRVRPVRVSHVLGVLVMQLFATHWGRVATHVQYAGTPFWSTCTVRGYTFLEDACAVRGYADLEDACAVRGYTFLEDVRTVGVYNF